MSDSAGPDFASFHELAQLVHNLGEELAGFRKRALTAEGRLKALEAANGPTGSELPLGFPRLELDEVRGPHGPSLRRI